MLPDFKVVENDKNWIINSAHDIKTYTEKVTVKNELDFSTR